MHKKARNLYIDCNCHVPCNVSIMPSVGPNVDIDIVSIDQNVIDIAAFASHLTQDHSPLLTL